VVGDSEVGVEPNGFRETVTCVSRSGASNPRSNQNAAPSSQKSVASIIRFSRHSQDGRFDSVD
jgi:hypothetical protein